MSKFKKGLWYLCNKTLWYDGSGLGRKSRMAPHFNSGYWYYCTSDGYLKGNYNRAIRIAGFHYKHFSDGEEIRIKAPK